MFYNIDRTNRKHFYISFVFSNAPCVPSHIAAAICLRNENGNGDGNDNTTNQCFDWLNEKKKIVLHVGHAFLAQFFDVVRETTTWNFDL